MSSLQPQTRAPDEPAPGRWLALALFMLLCVLQGCGWNTVAASPLEAVELFPSLHGKVDLLWTLNLAMIAQIPFTTVASWLLTRKHGLELSVRVGAVLHLICTSLRVVPLVSNHACARTLAARVMVVGSGAVFGSGVAFLQGAPSRLSSLWFPPSQRTRATSAAYGGANAGLAGGYLVSSYLITSVQALEKYLWVQFAASVVVCLLVLFFFPAAPESTANRARDSPEFIAGVKRCCRDASFLFLALAVSVVNGVFQTWTAMLPVLLDTLGYSEEQADFFSFISTITCVLGSGLAADVADRHFPRRLKALLQACLACALATFVWLGASMASPWSWKPLLPWSATTVAPAIGLGGFFVGATMPVGLELAAELTHPVPEGTSANFVMLLIQILGIVFLSVASAIASSAINVVLVAVVLSCLVVVSGVREVYLRQEPPLLTAMDACSKAEEGRACPPSPECASTTSGDDAVSVNSDMRL